MVDIDGMYDELATEDLLVIIREQLVNAALIDILELALDAMSYEDRADYRDAFAILRCALDTAERRQIS